MQVRNAFWDLASENFFPAEQCKHYQAVRFVYTCTVTMIWRFTELSPQFSELRHRTTPDQLRKSVNCNATASLDALWCIHFVLPCDLMLSYMQVQRWFAIGAVICCSRALQTAGCVEHWFDFCTDAGLGAAAYPSYTRQLEAGSASILGQALQ